MRWLRLLLALLLSRFRSKLSISETSELGFRVWLTDIDASIMNHAAMMTVFEAGRIDFMVRTGFFKMARQKKMVFPQRKHQRAILQAIEAVSKSSAHHPDLSPGRSFCVYRTKDHQQRKRYCHLHSKKQGEIGKK